MVGKYERGKDTAQDAVENTATAVGRIATIITTAVADVTREIGGLITQGFEMREAAKRARADEQRGARSGGAGTVDGRVIDDGAAADGAAEPGSRPGGDAAPDDDN